MIRILELRSSPRPEGSPDKSGEVMTLSVLEGAQARAALQEQAKAGPGLSGSQTSSVPGTPLRRWVDLVGQTAEDLDLLGQAFRFHPLALEDCLHFDQRPKLEEYAAPVPHLFVVTHNFSVLTTDDRANRLGASSMRLPRLLWAYGAKQRCAIQVLETHAFIGPTLLVTVHSQASAVLDTVFQRVKKEPALLQRGTDFVYYLVADALCDSNFPVLEQLGDLLDEVEENVLREPKLDPKDLERMHTLRKTLVSMRRVLSPQRDVIGSLARHTTPSCISEKTAPFFRDVYDHLTRISESIEVGRDLLSSSVDGYLSRVGQRTNEIMRQLTLLSSFMMPMTFLSGFFGMNFKHMPFDSPWVFIASMILMFAGLPVGMYLWFRHAGWISPSSSRRRKSDGA